MIKIDPQNLTFLAKGISENHKNVMVNEVNDHCLRLAVMQDATYDWHQHPNSDELFIVLEGELTVEFGDNKSVVLTPGDSFTVQAGKTHRTIAKGRTVNLCFETTKAETVFTAGG